MALPEMLGSYQFILIYSYATQQKHYRSIEHLRGSKRMRNSNSRTQSLLLSFSKKGRSTRPWRVIALLPTAVTLHEKQAGGSLRSSMQACQHQSTIKQNAERLFYPSEIRIMTVLQIKVPLSPARECKNKPKMLSPYHFCERGGTS